MTVSIKVVEGSGGWALYLNDYRVAGEKPWGGGRIIKEWSVDAGTIRLALKQRIRDRVSL